MFDVDLDERNINRDNAIVDDMDLMQLGMTWTWNMIITSLAELMAYIESFDHFLGTVLQNCPQTQSDKS